MGLDNGILMFADEPVRVPFWIRWLVKDDVADMIPQNTYGQVMSVYGKYMYDVCYWRKCWGIRNSIYDIFGLAHGESSMCEIFPEYTLPEIISLLKGLRGKKNWVRADSFIYYEHPTRMLNKNIICLRYMRKLLKRGKVRAFFYDSY